MKIQLSLIFIFLFVVSGCATNRSSIDVSLPGSTFPVTENNSKFVIMNVKDKRSFVDNPSTPDIPSIGFGGIANTDTQLLARAVGRKRNGFGKALGDVFLSEKQTVSSLVKDSVALSFSELGYKTAQTGQDIPNALNVDIDVIEFWTYIDVSFSKLGITTRITAKMTADGRTLTVTATEANSYMAVTENDWKKNINIALDTFVQNAKRQLAPLTKP